MNSESVKAIPAPVGPFPVLCMLPDGKEEIVGQGGDIDTARFGMTQAATSWLKSKTPKPGKPGRSVRYLDPNTVVLYYSDKKLRAVLMVEVCPVKPGETHVADILVERKGAK